MFYKEEEMLEIEKNFDNNSDRENAILRLENLFEKKKKKKRTFYWRKK